MDSFAHAHILSQFRLPRRSLTIPAISMTRASKSWRQPAAPSRINSYNTYLIDVPRDPERDKARGACIRKAGEPGPA